MEIWKNAMIGIRTLNNSDFNSWLKVYSFYAEHYQTELTSDGISTTWNWLMDTKHPVRGIAAEEKGELIAVAHYRSMPSPLRGINLGFLDDLVVIPRKRGSKAAKLILAEIKLIGKKEKWSKIRWITRDDNYRARSLYDSVAKKTNWIMYEMETDL